MSSGIDGPRPCPLCDEQRDRTFLVKSRLRLVRCESCAMVYADSVADEFASGSFYEHRPLYLSPEKLESDFAPIRFARELRLFRTWCAAGAVLDVGCSTGAYLYQLQARYPGAYKMLGVDVPGAALDYAQSRGWAISREPFLEMAATERRFDGITFWAVMEHLPHPKKFLEKAAQMLKPGGHCFILTPNLQSLAVRLLGAKYRYLMPEHLNYFTPATLKALARRARAFDLVDSGSTHFNPMVIWQDFWSGRPIVTDEERARLLKRTTGWKQSPALKPLHLLYRGVERLLGSMNLADNIFIVLRRISE